MQDINIPVVTIDGPSGSGKGTLARALASHFGWHLLDSGALYRGLAYYANSQAVDLEDQVTLAKMAETLPIRFEIDAEHTLDQTQIYIQDELCTQTLRTEETGRDASKIAAYPGVRQGLLALQQAFREAPGLVADGRDMGTVVFPEAFVKFYLTASAKARAERRYLQLQQWSELKGTPFDVSLAALEEDVIARDKRDTQRAVAPLKPATDAIMIDSSDMSIESVFQQMLTEFSNASK